jgi:hypothetical protein
MSGPAQSSHQDPPLFAHLHARDRGILLKQQKLREEEAAAEAKNAKMSASEQT